MSRTGSVAMFLLGILTAACGGGGGTLESDDIGIVGFHDFSSGPEKSFGIFVCGGDVVLDSVEPIESDGEIEMLGGVVHESSASLAPIGAANGFPPDVLAGTETAEIDGAVVTTSCEEAAPETRTQVVVGVTRAGPSGGTFERVRINHDNGSLDVDGYVIILCGDEMERCEDFAPEG